MVLIVFYANVLIKTFALNKSDELNSKQFKLSLIGLSPFDLQLIQTNEWLIKRSKDGI